MNTKLLLLVIALLLAGILGAVAYNASQPKTTGEQIADTIEDAADDVGDAVKDAADEVGDAAQGR